jgi:hypothetical protein
MQDSNPYVNEDEYAAEWASIIDDARADPRDGLDDLLAIVDRMMLDADVRSSADLDPELGRRLDYAREIVRGLERGDDIEQGDVDAALAAVTFVYDSVLPPGEGGDPGTIEPAAAQQLDVESAAGDQGETQTDP